MKRDNLNVDLDDELLNEVTGLCEWPVALLGNFKNNFYQFLQKHLFPL